MSQEHYQRVHGFSTIPVIHPALFFDDCSGTFNWTVAGTGADYTAEYDPSAAHVQTNGIILKTRATDPAALDHVTIYRRLWLPPRGVLRLQLFYSHLVDTPIGQLDIALIWNDGTLAHDIGIMSLSNNGALYYISGYSAGDFEWTHLTGWSANIIEHSWNNLDLSANLQTNFHHKIQLNEHVLDGTTIPVNTHAIPLTKHVHLVIRLRSGGAAQVTAYIDQILLTQESP